MQTSASTVPAANGGTWRQPPSYPVSVKGVVVQAGRVLLLHNDRDEWELPGGRLELDETPEQCVAREIAEETGWRVRTGPILDSWLYHIDQVDRRVFIVTYGCALAGGQDDLAPVLSHEHKRVEMFGRHDVADLPMPQGYKRSVAAWYAHLDQLAGQPDRTGRTPPPARH
jgi:8-oxo-dGTP pyrophosphatase MutT (NUDIX family)